MQSSTPDQPATPAALQAARRLLCPEHGPLDPMCHESCPHCDRRPYDLDNPEDRSLLRTLRAVSRARRTNLARLISVIPAFGVSIALYALTVHTVGGAWLHGVFLLGLLAAFSRPADWLLDHIRSRFWRAVDRELDEQRPPALPLSRTTQTAP